VVSVFWPGALVRGKSQEFEVSDLLQNDAAPDAQQNYSYRDKLGPLGTTVRYLDTGTAADQATLDYWLEQYRDGGVTVLLFDWYQGSDLTLVSGALDDRQFLQRAFQLYLASTVPNKPKFALVLISGQAGYDANTSATKLPPLAPTGGTWANFLPVFVPSWVALTQSDLYWKTTDGRPIAFLFDSSGPTWDVTRVNQLRAAFFNRGFLCGNSNAMVTALSLDAVFFYGPNQTAFGTGHRPYSDQIAKDFEFWTLNGSNLTLATLTVKNDGRPRIQDAAPASGNWVDCPTYEQVEDRIQNAINFARAYSPIQAVFFHPAEEPDESGDVLATPQSIVRSPNAGMSPWLAAIANVKQGTLPATYTNHYHPNWLHARISTVGAGWALVQGSTVYGAFEYAESRNSTAGNSKTFTSSNRCIGLRLRARKSPGVGSFTLVFDGGAPIVIVETDAVTTLNALVFDSGVVAVGVHTMTFTQSVGIMAPDEIEEVILR
jgi:hypothetical protein